MSKVIDLKSYKQHKESVELIEGMLDFCCAMKGIDWSERNTLTSEEIVSYLNQYLDYTEAEEELYGIVKKLFSGEPEMTRAEKGADILMNNVRNALGGDFEPYHVLDEDDLEKAFEAIDRSYPDNPEISNLIRNKITERLKKSQENT